MNSEIDKILNSKKSAYRSMRMAQYGLTKPTTKKNKNNLMNWTLEDWVNLNALLLNPPQYLPCGKQYKGQIDKTVCRPSKKINEKTPKPLAGELTRTQILKAIEKKNKNERINWRNI